MLGSMGAASRASCGWTSSSVVVSAMRRRGRSRSSAARAASAGTAAGAQVPRAGRDLQRRCSPARGAPVSSLRRRASPHVLGASARRLAEAGLVAVVTATSPRRLPHPNGGTPLTGTNPIAIAVPSSDGQPWWRTCRWVPSPTEMSCQDVRAPRSSSRLAAPTPTRRSPSRPASSCSSARSPDRARRRGARRPARIRSRAASVSLPAAVGSPATAAPDPLHGHRRQAGERHREVALVVLAVSSLPAK